MSEVNGSPGMADVGSTSGGGQADPSQHVIWWRDRIATSIARSRKIRGANFVQIASCDPSTGEPRCRTVVFRGFLPIDPASEGNCAPCVMKMITDSRSNKVTEVGQSGEVSLKKNNLELVYWFGKSSEQYRIRGHAQFVGDTFTTDPRLSSQRVQQWGNLSDSAREQFFWPDPGVIYPGTPPVVPEGGRDLEGKVIQPPPKSFLLMLLHPTRVDYLRLTDNYKQVDELVVNEGGDADTQLDINVETSWRFSRLNP